MNLLSKILTFLFEKKEEETSHTAGPFRSWLEAYNYGAELVVREDAYDLSYLNNVTAEGDEIYITFSLKKRMD